MALVWAAGIIWFAVDFAGSRAAPAGNSVSNETASGDSTDASATGDNDQKIANAFGLD
jgi:hypothetical protein